MQTDRRVARTAAAIVPGNAQSTAGSAQRLHVPAARPAPGGRRAGGLPRRSICRSGSRCIPCRPCSPRRCARTTTSGDATRRSMARASSARRPRPGWTRRYHLPAGALDPEGHVLPCAGTKEALFMIAQAVVPERKAGRTPAAAAEPVLQRLSRRRRDRRRRAGPALGVRGDRASAGARGSRAGAARAHRRLLSVLAGEPAGRGRRSRLLPARDRAGAPLRLRAAGRRMLCRDLRRSPVGALEAAWRWMAGSTTCWFSTRSPSAPAPPACARASWRAIRPACGVRAPAQLRRGGAAAADHGGGHGLWQDEEHVIANRALYQAKFDLVDVASAGF